jgi:beta-1,4-glucosyltransferase
MPVDKIINALTLVNDVTFEEALDNIVNTKRPTTVGFLNQHAYNLISKDDSLADLFINMDYLFRDGKGIELACRYYKIDPKKNLNGTDLIPALVAKLVNCPDEVSFFAYGTESPWLDDGARNLFQNEKFLSLDGFQDDQAYLDHFATHETGKLNVIILAMGMPKQERIAARLKLQAKGRLIIICGGAILDFQAGRVKRAPSIFRQFGMEWLYRLTCEPKRLFSRYVIGIPVFFFNVYKSNK